MGEHGWITTKNGKIEYEVQCNEAFRYEAYCTEEGMKLIVNVLNTRSGIVISRECAEDTLKELKQTAADVGGCDHDVNICICHIYRLIDDWQQALEE
jgi:hypothetical protein